jgi:hypothetical protein
VPASHAHASSPGTTSTMTSRLCSNVASRPRARGGGASFPPAGNWEPLTSWRRAARPSPQGCRRSVWREGASVRRSWALLLAVAPSRRSAVPTWACSLACLCSHHLPPSTGFFRPLPSQAPGISRLRWAPV